MRTKVLLFATAALATLASCNNQVDIPQVDNRGNEIRLCSGGITVETKSVVEVTEATLRANGFKALVYSADNGSVIFNKKVTYDNGFYHVPGEHYFYPQNGSVSALGIYPASNNIEFDQGWPVLNYTYTDGDDLVGAWTQYMRSGDGAISLEFEHLLAQVAVKCKKGDERVDYLLKSIEFRIPGTGLYDFADGWCNLDSHRTSTFFSNSGHALSGNGLNSIGEPITMIPCTTTMRIKWECRNSITHETVAQYDRTVDVYLPKGVKTTLNVTLQNDQSNEMDIDISVDPFENNDETIIL